MKKHNGIISFWKFMFSILIVLFHCELLAQNGENVLFKAGRIGVEFFFITSGYLMAQKAFKNENKDLNNIGKEAILYIWKKAKTFFPYILVAFIISIFVKGIYQKSKLVISIWNLLLLEMSGVRTTSVVGQTWYISAMLISMLILYPLIRKYKKTFTHIMAPIIVILVGGWMSHKYGTVAGPLDYTGFVYKGLLRALFEISLGTIAYIIAQKIKEIKFTKLSKWILTIIEIVGFTSIFFIVNIKGASQKYEFIMILILFISISIAFSEKTIFYKFANNKFVYYLEKISLPIYLNQIWIILLAKNNLSHLNYYTKMSISVIATIIISIIIMHLIELAQKIFEKHKIKIKKLFIIEDDKYEI